MAKRYEDRYGRDSHRRDRDHAEDRGYMDRASDEVRSWFGDDDAERRRDMDEQRERARDSRYGVQSSRSHWDSSEGSRSDRDRDWNRSSNYPQSDWDRRPSDRQEPWRAASQDDRTRYEDWSRTWGSPDRDRDRLQVRDGDWAARQGWSSNRPSTSRPTERDDERWGKGPKGYQRSDARILEEVCDRLTYSDVDAENVEVTVTNGEVTLSGSVRDRGDKRRAEDLAEEVSGVRDVHNSIRVERPDRGIGQSEKSASDQPGTVLGVNPTTDGTSRRRS